MSKEIKIKSGEVKSALSTLKNATKTTKTTVPTDIKGKNNLDVVKKIEGMNKDLKNLTDEYDHAFSLQIAQTEAAIDMMEDADKKVASSIKGK
ncbi:DUF5344 family protein [Bacillus sp. CLL-7-23]|uniref:DUF5344 family protein n=1 Tax=Bacillus changyiensis TaxID=3004103 RepID=A0ABT4X2E5_9BACI|nr:DUF5344 family protein [Bacillus changyiensis]MDA7026456.1 DUF5344 family protein [Bacillus changyiensis]